MSDSRIGIAGGKGVIEPVDVVEGEATGIVDVDVDGGSKDEVQREDPRAELRAMEAIAEALEPLTRSGRARVLRWATDHYGSCELPPTTSPAPRSSVTVLARSTGNATSSLDAFTDLADLFAAAQPENEMQRALVVAYWKQVRDGEYEIDAQSVNTELKHLGYGSGNITRVFDHLKRTRPQLVVQLRKSGSSQQARKKFKVTIEGQREVERMLLRALT